VLPGINFGINKSYFLHRGDFIAGCAVIDRGLFECSL
jgi:hypothetical protein